MYCVCVRVLVRVCVRVCAASACACVYAFMWYIRIIVLYAHLKHAEDTYSSRRRVPSFVSRTRAAFIIMCGLKFAHPHRRPSSVFRAGAWMLDGARRASACSVCRALRSIVHMKRRTKNDADAADDCSETCFCDACVAVVVRRDARCALA